MEKDNVLEYLAGYLEDFICCNSLYEATLKKLRAICAVYWMIAGFGTEKADRMSSYIYGYLLNDEDRKYITEDDFILYMHEDIY